MGYLLHHLLIEASQSNPDKQAVVFADQALTYHELNEASNKIATVLIELGIALGDRVGIYMNKSIPSIVSIYGILKAGAVYVPLDPQAPHSRISYIIDNCDIRCLLTSTAKANIVEEIADSTKALEVAIFTDSNLDISDFPIRKFTWEQVQAISGDQLPDISTNHCDLAYIIYTSGSTGNPKGVMITHLNSLTFVNWAFEEMDVTSDDRFSSHAPLHFDLSIFDVFVAAKAGGTLYLVPETLSIFPTRLSSWISQNKISIWYSVPSILSMMASHGELDKKNFDSLRRVIFAGEVFPIKYLRQLMKFVPNPLYYNLYGPTETNVVTYYKVPKLPDDQTTPIPIGKCCENMGVFAIGSDGQVISEPGEEGELLARGSGVARGYWGDQAKTEKVFIKNPVQNNFFDRVYRTGDVVSLDDQGNYIYKGRIDHMIKSRGYRIEIGEIESSIYSHPDVKEVAVIALPDDLITNRIIALVVVASESSLSSSELRQFCANTLPKYMIPEEFKLTNNLPKTSTGKIDRPELLKQSQAVG